jgi:hypothetical protein
MNKKNMNQNSSDLDIFLSDAKKLVDSEFALFQHPVKLPVMFVSKLNDKYFELYVGKKKTWYTPGNPYPSTDTFMFYWMKDTEGNHLTD